MISSRAWQQLFTDPDLELSVERIVHGDQRFTFVRPLRPGDIVIATARIDRVRLRAGSELISATVDITGRTLSSFAPHKRPSLTLGRRRDEGDM